MPRTTNGRGSSNNGSDDRGQTSAEQKRKAKLRAMYKTADNYASMGGRGPKKGSAEYNKRMEQWKSAAVATKKGFEKAVATQKQGRKDEKQRPARSTATTKKASAPSKVPPRGSRGRGTKQPY